MRIRLLLLISLLLTSLLPFGLAPVTAQGDDVAQILGRINALRQQNGLLPLDLSSTLTAAAQRHSDDMARTGNIDHTGSDGSTVDSRIRDAGYGHWRNFGLWGENIYGGQMANVDAAWNFWINSQVHRANILKPRYREIGIGVGRSDNGTYYTLNFGSQPNVLPFFVTGSAPVVTLLLTNENDITTGEGVSIMGQATQVRIAEGTDPSSAQWQPWAQSIPFQLSAGDGQKTITVEYKDELGRGTRASRTFNVSDLGSAPPTPTETAEATATIDATPTETNTPAPTATGTLPPTETATPQPTETPTAAPTDTPQPIDTPTPEPPTATATSGPTVTPALLASPTPRATQLIAANLAAYSSASRLTPPPPRSANPDRPLFNFTDAPSLDMFTMVLGLQALVLAVIGAVAVIRLRRRS
jgi:Cysteine-rich secretory protein family